LEVKCPYSAKDKGINTKSVPYLHDIDGTLELDRNHNYFYQVHGQLLCTGASAVDFAVYTQHDFYVTRILRDDDFIEGVVQKLNDFFGNYFRQALLEKFVARNYFEEICCDCVKFNDVIQGCSARPIFVIAQRILV
jgi:hypothetical protein